MTSVSSEDKGPGRVPDLFIIGAAKSGTTSLYAWLGGHPQIYMSPLKEPNFFAPDLARGRNAMRYPDDLQQYLALFADAGDATRVGEASVRYLYSSSAPSLIADFQPQARIVVALRNPAEMAFSLYLQRRAHGSERLDTFAEAFAAEADRNSDTGTPTNGDSKLGRYLDRASYGEQLPRWLDAFGRERVHVIIFEEMVADPAKAFRSLLEFLEVDPDYRPDEFRAHNPAHRDRGVRLRRIPIVRRARGLVWAPVTAVAGQARTRALAERLRRVPLLRKEIERPRLDADLRTRLEGYYAADVAKTSELVGRDLAAVWFGR